MRFYGVSIEDLNMLQDSLGILKHIFEDNFYPFLYATVNQGEVFEEVKNRFPETSAMAVAIPLSDSTLRFLLGSGLKLDGEDGVYSNASDGPRLSEVSEPSMLYLNEISGMAIASDTIWLKDFLQSRAPNTQNSSEVKREKPVEQVTESEGVSQVKEPTQPASAPKIARVPGFKKILMAADTRHGLGVTELIELSDYLELNSDPDDLYLYATDIDKEWLIHSDDVEKGRENLLKTLQTKYKLKNPKVQIITGKAAINLLSNII